MTWLDAILADRQDDPGVQVATLPRAHLVGIYGAGMRALADVLDEAGWQISGSDLAARFSAAARYEIRTDHDAATIDPALDCVIHSNAVARNNPELRRARQLGVSVLSYPQMLGRLMQSRRGVAVAGTHGKSTTTAMAGEILTAAGLDPTLVVGATPIGGDSGGRFGGGRWMLAEACEYRDSFRHLKPEAAAILNIEPDHFDCFDSPDELQGAFTRFAQCVPCDGLLVARDDCATTRRVCSQVDCRTETFGLSPAATWYTTNLLQRLGYYSFQLRCRERFVGEIRLPVPGLHNVLNALAAAALASYCGASAAAIRQGLEQFVGLRRRLQLLGEVRDVVLVDDYAHHPTEITATLTTLRQMYPHRRLWCVFQPHQASRLVHLLDEFARSLQNADKIVVADVYRAREGASPGKAMTAGHLSARVADLGGDVVQLAAAPQIRNHLRESLAAGDVLVTVGAGDIGRVAHELGKGLRTFRQAG